MFTYCRITLVAILVFSLIINCSKSTKTKCPPRTPKANEEAELIALCLSGQMVAPQDLYEQVRRDLASIRATFGDTLEATRLISFWPPWQPGELGIGVDDTTAQQILSGEYHAWDALNEKYELTSMNTRHLSGIGAVFLTFRGRLHPCRLGELYERLPGVEITTPNHIPGDWSKVCARQTLTGMSYLFHHGWGSCPSGCIYSEYWYFRVDDNWPMFVGHWVPHEDPNVPEWWEEAKVNRDHYCD